MSEPSITATEIDVSSTSLVKVDHADVMTRLESFGAGHLWTISVLYVLENPQHTPDGMRLDQSNFFGLSGVSCYRCDRAFDSALLDVPCDGPS